MTLTGLEDGKRRKCHTIWYVHTWRQRHQYSPKTGTVSMMTTSWKWPLIGPCNDTWNPETLSGATKVYRPNIILYSKVLARLESTCERPSGGSSQTWLLVSCDLLSLLHNAWSRLPVWIKNPLLPHTPSLLPSKLSRTKNGHFQS